MKKINKILLIDDDEPTNFIHQLVIDEAGCCEDLVSLESGVEALEYFKDNKDEQPDIIFLDINMPLVNGWEFLEEYKKMNGDKRAKVIIVMLSTSLNPKDRERANGIKEISEFRNKPLTVEILEEITETYF